jgi:hypothetical protein
MIRTYVTFKSDIADEAEWGPGAKLIAPAGRKHSDLFREAVSRRATLKGETWNEEDFGWEFLCNVDGFCVSVLVEQAPEWLVIIIPVSLLKSLIPGRRERAVRTVCMALQEVLTNDARLHDARWYTREEWEAQARGEGSPTP